MSNSEIKDLQGQIEINKMMDQKVSQGCIKISIHKKQKKMNQLNLIITN